MILCGDPEHGAVEGQHHKSVCVCEANLAVCELCALCLVTTNNFDISLAQSHLLFCVNLLMYTTKAWQDY